MQLATNVFSATRNDFFKAFLVFILHPNSWFGTALCKLWSVGHCFTTHSLVSSLSLQLFVSGELNRILKGYFLCLSHTMLNKSLIKARSAIMPTEQSSFTACYHLLNHKHDSHSPSPRVSRSQQTECGDCTCHVLLWENKSSTLYSQPVFTHKGMFQVQCKVLSDWQHIHLYIQSFCLLLNRHISIMNAMLKSFIAYFVFWLKENFKMFSVVCQRNRIYTEPPTKIPLIWQEEVLT